MTVAPTTDCAVASRATPQWRLHTGDAHAVLSGMADESVDCVVTSPPYWGMRDYGVAGQYGHEPTLDRYVQRLRVVFRQARRVLTPDGTLWLNLGDCYGGSWHNYIAPNSTAPTATDQRRHRRGSHFPPQSAERPKNLLGVPWRVAFALQADGWILRNAVVWHKPNGMPESVRDRLSCRYEMVFLLVRNRRYWFDLDAIRAPLRRPGVHNIVDGNRDTEQTCFAASGRRRGASDAATGRNPGDVWSISARPYRGSHFAASPIDIPLRCIAAGCKPDGIVLDPFSGSGTTGEAALRLGRDYVGIDLNKQFHDLAKQRFARIAKDTS